MRKIKRVAKNTITLSNSSELSVYSEGGEKAFLFLKSFFNPERMAMVQSFLLFCEILQK